MIEFTVTWSCNFDADDPIDAAEQGWSAIEDAIKSGGPTSILVVRDAKTDELAGRFDMAYQPPIDIGRDG